MKKLGLALTVLLVPGVVLAHGGSQKAVGNYIVTLQQTPISPVAGETVKMDFAITDRFFTPQRNKKVILILTKTVTGNASKDQVVVTQNFTTDANGDFEFSYRFPTTNYYDIDLDFANQATGFLVQPRGAVPYVYLWLTLPLVMGAYLIGRKYAYPRHRD